METYIHIHTHIHIHIHTSYMDTVMDPYEYILSLTLTFGCQTTIYGSSEIINCVGPYLDYIDCTRMSVVVRVVQDLYECRCDERLKSKSEESTLLVYTGLFGELEHLKIETRLIDEMFASVMGEYVFLK